MELQKARDAARIETETSSEDEDFISVAEQLQKAPRAPTKEPWSVYSSSESISDKKLGKQKAVDNTQPFQKTLLSLDPTSLEVPQDCLPLKSVNSERTSLETQGAITGHSTGLGSSSQGTAPSLFTDLKVDQSEDQENPTSAARSSARPFVGTTTGADTISPVEPANEIDVRPPSAALDTGTQTEIREVYTRGAILKLTKRVFCKLTDEGIDPDIDEKYRNQIAKPLDARLNVHITQRDPQDFWTINLKLAGKSQSSLKPTIVIWCSNQFVFHQVLKAVRQARRFQFLRQPDLAIMPCVSCINYTGEIVTRDIDDGRIQAALGVGIIGGSLVILSTAWYTFSLRKKRRNERHWLGEHTTQFTQLAPAEMTQTPRTLQKNRWRSPKPSRTATIESLPEQGSSDASPECYADYVIKILDADRDICTLDNHNGRIVAVYQQKSATAMQSSLGGIMLLNGRMYGFTVGHTLLDLPKSSTAQTKALSQGEVATLLEFNHLGKEVEHEEWNLNEVQSEAKACSAETKMAPDANEEIASTDKEKSATDSKLFTVGHYDTSFLNDYLIFDVTLAFEAAMDITPTVIADSSTGHMEGIQDPVPHKDVFVNAGMSGVVTGRLNKTMAFMKTKDGLVACRQIVLTRCLMAGDSGSWVWQNDRVCGFIFARHESLPMAYMHPMRETLVQILQKLDIDRT